MADQTRKTTRLSLVSSSLSSSSSDRKKKIVHPDNDEVVVIQEYSSSSPGTAIKRRRLLDSSSSSSSSTKNQNQNEKASFKDDDDDNESVTMATVVSSSLVISSTHVDNNNDSTTDDDDDDNLYNGIVPTIEIIGMKLCTVGCSSKYSKNEIIQALKDLCLWTKRNFIEKNVTHTSLSCYMANFSELGMLSRIVLFLKSNTNDVSYCYYATDLIKRYLHADYTVNSLLTTSIPPNRMTSKFIQQGGIQILVLANDAYAKKRKTTSQLRALKNIWMTINLILFLQPIGEDTTEVLDKNQCISIFESCIKTMNMLKNDNNGVSCNNDGSAQPDVDDDIAYYSSVVAGYIFKTLRFFIESKVMPINDIIDTNCSKGYVGFLMKDRERTINNGVGVWLEAARFYIACFEQNILSRETRSDVIVLLPFCVECIKKLLGCKKKNDYCFDPSSYPMRLLCEVSKIIGSTTIRKTPGLMTTLGTLVDSNTTDVHQYTKNVAYKLLAHLCKPSRSVTAARALLDFSSKK